jgi:hypothetical protein
VTENGESFRAEALRMHNENKNQMADLADKLDKMRDAVYKETTEMKVNIAMLQVKCGIWGIVGGAIPALLIVLAKLLK